MHKQIIISLLFTMTIATYTAENRTQEENKDIVQHIISRGYPQKNSVPKSAAELLQTVILDNKGKSCIRDNSLTNLKKSRLFVVDNPSKL